MAPSCLFSWAWWLPLMLAVTAAQEQFSPCSAARPFRAAAMLCSSAALLLTSIFLPTHALNTTTTSPSSDACEPAACGDLRIAYPFWLGGTHPPTCGYHAFQVTCDANGTTASLQNSFLRYQILHISYDNSSFTVANVGLSGAEGPCDGDKLSVNASSDLGLAPFGISATNQKLFFLYNCTTLRAPPPSWTPVSCGSNASSLFAWLAGGYMRDDAWGPVEGNCTVSTMPVRGYVGASGKDYRRLMKAGFLLDYTAGDCVACQDSGGLCRINTTYDIFQCHCAHGVSSDPFTCDGFRRFCSWHVFTV